MKRQNKKPKKTVLRRRGDIGEKIIARVYRRAGFQIVEMNYLKSVGEIDIVALRAGKTHFVEVKTVSRETRENPTFWRKIALKLLTIFGKEEYAYRLLPFSANEKNNFEHWLPEEKLNPWKQERLRRTIELYLVEKRFHEEQDWQFDLATIRIDERAMVAYHDIWSGITL